MVLGPRGCGKTVLLSEILRRAEDDGRVVLWADARPDAAEHMSVCNQLRNAAIDVVVGKRKLTGITAGFGPISIGAQWSTDDKRTFTYLQSTLEWLVNEAEKKRNGRGVLLVVDEVHNLQTGDAGELASTLQYLTKVRGRPVGLLAGGLTGDGASGPMTSTVIGQRGRRPRWALRAGPLPRCGSGRLNSSVSHFLVIWDTELFGRLAGRSSWCIVQSRPSTAGEEGDEGCEERP